MRLRGDRIRWVRAVLLVGVAYMVAGIPFATLAHSVASSQVRTVWRMAAWGISVVAFASHIGYEQVRLRSSSVTTACHAALAVALGAFALAVSATLHSLSGGSSTRLALSAVVAWPVLTALPAFVVALIAAAALGRARRRAVRDVP